MKKLARTMIMTILLALALTGCNTSDGVDGESKKEKKDPQPLTLQVLKMDEEEGITLDNNDVYKDISEIIAENPDMGIADDFSIQILDVVENMDGTIDTLAFLAINRLDEPLKNINFDYTLGNTEGDYIFDGIEVDLTESDVGVIQAHGVVPFYLEVTEEQIELLSTLDQDNSVMEFDKFKFESAK